MIPDSANGVQASKPKFRLALVFCAVCLVFSGSAHGQSGKPGGTLRFGLSKDISILNPFQTTTSIDANVRSLMYESLLSMDLAMNLVPALAASWNISPDGRQYTFHLRENVSFHNGSPLTAEDVKWSAEYAMDPKNSAYGRSKLLVVSSLTAIDRMSVRFVLKEPYSPFLTSFYNIQIFPVVPKGSLGPGTEAVTSPPPGTGAFRFVEWKKGEAVRLQRNQNYWKKGLPYLNELVFKPIADETVRFTALRAGDLDISERIPLEHLERIQKGEIKGIKTVLAYAAMDGLAINNRKPPLSDVRVRQAIAYGIDKQELILGAYSGIGRPTTQLTVPNSKWYVPMEDRQRNIPKAKSLLSEAGYPSGLKIKVLAYPENLREVQIIQSQVKPAGIEFEIEMLDWTTYNERVVGRDFQLAMRGSGTENPDPDFIYYPEFHTEVDRGRSRNTAGYSNPVVDKLLEDGRRKLDFAERYRIYKEVVEIIHREVPRIYLTQFPYVFGLRPNVQNFETNNDGARYILANGGLLTTWLQP